MQDGPGPGGVCGSSSGLRWGYFPLHLKKWRLFLTSPKCQDYANAAELLMQRLASAAFVRQAARGGTILAFGGS
ncbi:hypothetical protein K070079E91_59270 [Eisenbergiella porci]